MRNSPSTNAVQIHASAARRLRARRAARGRARRITRPPRISPGSRPSQTHLFSGT